MVLMLLVLLLVNGQRANGGGTVLGTRMTKKRCQESNEARMFFLCFFTVISSIGVAAGTFHV